MATGYANVIINDAIDAGGIDTINLNGVIDLAAGNQFSLIGDVVNIFGTVNTTGAGSINVTTTRNIVLANATLSTVDGGITLDANASGSQVADFNGIDAISSVITTTGSGDIQLLGKGSEIGNDTAGQSGIVLGNGTRVTSTGDRAGRGQHCLGRNRWGRNRLQRRRHSV